MLRLSIINKQALIYLHKHPVYVRFLNKNLFEITETIPHEHTYIRTFNQIFVFLNIVNISTIFSSVIFFL